MECIVCIDFIIKNKVDEVTRLSLFGYIKLIQEGVL